MQKSKQLIATVIAIPLLIGGWALFRPELLFVNQTVDEKLPMTAEQTSNVLSSGIFESYAHETKGTAEIINTGGKNYLQLRDFHTSNGPDVRVYLVKGGDASGKGVKEAGFVDLGSIKGNIGTQNYEIPSAVNLGDYQSVSIWCKRFSVGFGGASLKSSATKTSSLVTMHTQLVGLGVIEVTSGSANGDSRFSGKSSIIEDQGKRYVSSDFKKTAGNDYQLRLVKKETLAVGSFPADAKFIDLGKLKKGKSKVEISHDIDAWLYRSVAIVDPKTNKIISFILLRSVQEGKFQTNFTGAILS